MSSLNQSKEQASNPEQIAIIGLSGRYPLASNLQEYWENLKHGRDCITEIPADRWEHSQYYDAEIGKAGKSYGKWGGFTKDIDKFDPLFFNIAPREAELMDPQERVFLETVWATIEDAGYSRQTLEQVRDIGVFVGTMNADYSRLYTAAWSQGAPEITPVSYWSMANRVSFVFNWQGPSVAIDTACSSSLTAIHLACESIKRGECKLAIAGGVYLTVHPAQYLLASQRRMLSKSGRCQVFSADADGMVNGEGVGALFLKPLQAAIDAGDHIYGVIRGSMVNAGGRTIGYSVPNFQAQADLIQKTLAASGVDARTISYVEAHGTGTTIGDPIEILGLTEAYSAYQVEKQSCAIGSAKSNIGHLESAAGIAGLTKVLLQMNHQQLVASLHAEPLNPRIDFATTPFKVQRALAAWPRPVVEIDGEQKEYPRRAGISSFGAGGANAHLIVEEYVTPSVTEPAVAMASQPPQLILLSAQHEERLQAYARKLLVYLEQISAPNPITQELDGTADPHSSSPALPASTPSLASIAYTLQVGREAMAHRLALVVTDIDDLCGKLRAYLAGETIIAQCHWGQARQDRAMISLLSDDDDIQHSIQQWLQKRKLEKLAAIWVKGLEIEWSLLHGTEQPLRVPLPTYPFARERYWITPTEPLNTGIEAPNGNAAAALQELHPLVHQNTSTLTAQRFRTTFRGDEFFLRDHQVQEEKILPGVAYLEMARAAGELAIETAAATLTQIKDVVWLRPLIVKDDLLETNLSLRPDASGELHFQVRSCAENEQPVVHAEGRLIFATTVGNAIEEVSEETTGEATIIDIPSIQQRCPKIRSGAACYQQFQQQGITYGSTFQVVAEVVSNDREALARLQLPAEVTDESYILHPSLLDGALQSAVELLADHDGATPMLYLPFALDAIEILSAIPTTVYAYVTRLPLQSAPPLADPGHFNLAHFNLALLDETGRVCVKLHNFTVKALAPQAYSVSDQPIAASCLDAAMQQIAARLPDLTPEAEAIEQESAGFAALDSFAQRGLCEAWQQMGVLPSAGTRYTRPDLAQQLNLLPRYQRFFEACLHILAQAGYLNMDATAVTATAKVAQSSSTTLTQAAAALAERYPLLQPHVRLLTTCLQRLPEILQGQVPATEVIFPNSGLELVKGIYQGTSTTNYANQLVALAVQSIVEQHLPTLAAGEKIRVIEVGAGTGGTSAVVLAALATHATQIDYLYTDISQGFLRHGQRHFGDHYPFVRFGLLDIEKSVAMQGMEGNHADIVLGTNVVHATQQIQPTLQTLKGLLKANGLLILNEATCFSAFTTLTFGLLDGWWAFADGEARIEHTPLLSAEQWQQGLKTAGFQPVPFGGTVTGLPTSQVVLLAESDGVVERMSPIDNDPLQQPRVDSSDHDQRIRDEQGKGETLLPIETLKNGDRKAATATDLTVYLQQLFAAVLKTEPSRLQLDQTFEHYGIDSIVGIEIVNRLRQDFGSELSATLLFEYMTLEKLADYLLTQHADALPPLLTTPNTVTPTTGVPMTVAPTTSSPTTVTPTSGAPMTVAPTSGAPMTVAPTSGAPTINGPRQDQSAHPVAPPFASPQHRDQAQVFGDQTRLQPNLLQSKPEPVAAEQRSARADIAIIGLSGRYPMAENLAEFWANLQAGRSSIREIPVERWDYRRYSFPGKVCTTSPAGSMGQTFPGERYNEPRLPVPTKATLGMSYSKWGGFIDDVDKFDPLFFNISPREAARMDPQERLFLETVWATVEDAGYSRQSLANVQNVGVFVGVMNAGYSQVASSVSTQAGVAYWSIANRVSYLFDWQGPSLAVDTACSSSLTAIHLACQSLKLGECQMAVAGGVNLIVHPDHYAGLATMQMLTADNKVKAFGADADGFVAGEGVGAILLKPLAQAQADGDQIYGVIKGSAMNAGGKTSGYTVPNPNAQRDLIAKALTESGIEADTISYVEAHGTGTSLGDPIEITGLSQAFGQTDATGYRCAIGSVKSNIGHLESGAGIAGLTKVLLQMKHQQLVPSLHAERLNPHIDFAATPFVVQRELTAWNPPTLDVAGEQRTVPRRAGVSSFGAGGANAHLIIEEYVPLAGGVPAVEAAPQPPQLILLSAKNEERLRAYASKLLAYLEVHPDPTPTLANIAHTLQVGREAMESRLAFVVATIEDLCEKLTAYLAGTVAIEQCFQGRVKAESARVTYLRDDEDGQALIQQWLTKGKIEHLAAVWVEGLHVDWSRLPRAEPPRRISLPTYPFARARHWLPETAQRAHAANEPVPPLLSHPEMLHPLLHKNISNLQSLRFSTTFTGNEFFLQDHQVQGKRVLPGVAYLEMARAAGQMVVDEETVTQLKDLVWLQPIVVERDEPREVHLSLHPDEEGAVRYEASTLDHAGQPVVHAAGRLIVGTAVQEAGIIDLAAIRERCPQIKSGVACYQQFQEQGVTHGPTFQVLTEVVRNDKEALARLRLPDAVADKMTDGSYLLHPSLLDGLLQSVIGLIDDDHGSRAVTYLPFALDSLEVLATPPTAGYAYVTRLAVESEANHSNLEHFNLALLDETGRVCLRLHNFTVKASSPPTQGWYYQPYWTRQALSQGATVSVESGEEGNATAGDIVLVIPAGLRALGDALAHYFPQQRVIQLLLSAETLRLDATTWAINPASDTANDTDLAECLHSLTTVDTLYFMGGLSEPDINLADLNSSVHHQEQGVLNFFHLIKLLERHGLLTRLSALKVLTDDVQQLHPQEATQPWGAGLIGLAMSLAKEYPTVEVSVIDVVLTTDEAGQAMLDQADISAIIAETGRQGQPVLLRQGVRYIRQLAPLTLPDVETARTMVTPSPLTPAPLPPYRKKGVYLILGGAGGIGLETAVHLAREVQANLVLVGRSVLPVEKVTELERIRAAGGDYLYCQADGTGLAQMQAVVQQAKAAFGAIHGVIHSALVLRDSAIHTMTEATLLDVLAPKVTGSVVLATAVKEEPLDFMLFYSSSQSFWGNAGQSNYAAASTFQDAYARYLNWDRPYPVKVINWGYWGSVGVVATDVYRARMAQLGVQSIGVAEGMTAIDQILAAPLAQVAAVKIGRSAFTRMGIESQRQLTVLQPESASCLDAAMQQIATELSDLTPEPAAIEQESAGLAALDAFAQRGLCEAWQQMGVLQNAGARYTRPDLAQQLNIQPNYQRFFDASLHILAQAGYLNVDATTVAVTSKVTQPRSTTLTQAGAALAQRYPLLQPHVRLLVTCLERLPEILQGQVPATEVIFPNSGLELVKGIYQGTSTTNYANQLVALTVQSIVEQRLSTLAPGEKIRVIEVGAGTGGTTGFVLAALAPHAAHIDYLYTDISQSFLRHGQQHFGDRYPFVRFGLLDIEKSVAAQGMEGNRADIVLGTNVVHATQQIQPTLQTLKGLLKTNGLLILNEATCFSAFTTLTFGLLDGWWAFAEGEERIEHTPLLSAEQWQQGLKIAGFNPVPLEEAVTESPTSQVVILAESDGVVEREASTKTAQLMSVPTKLATDRPLPRLPRSAHEEPEANAVRPLPVINPHQELAERVTSTIIQILSNSLQIPAADIEADMAYIDLGVDSILAVEIINQLNQQLNIALRTTDLFNYADIQSLRTHIMATFPEKLPQSISQQSGPQQAGSQQIGPEQAAITPDYQPVERLFGQAETHVKPLPSIAFTGNGLSNGSLGNQEVSERLGSEQQGLATGVEPQLDIAIIGIAGRFPGAEDTTSFGQNLLEGRNAIVDVTDQRWPATDFYSPDRNRADRSISKWAGLLTDIDKFDPLFFNISPREAECMDPQQRLFLQEAWAALEDAGYTESTVAGQKCGVFVGCGAGDYQQQLTRAGIAEAYSFMGNATSILAARIAYHLNLKGPSIAIDTACSSALVAIHLACESLRLGTSDLAIAGGVSVLTTPSFHILASQTGMLSPRGQCRPFAAGADGFVPAEGVGAVILKGLPQAVADGDQIYGVIKGSAINQDGKTNGITAPNGPAQTTLASAVYAQFDIDPTTISYVEAHGTGTALGDPIEVGALTDAFRQYTDQQGYCAIGSVKANIGHTLTTAGVAGVIKVLLALKYKKLPPSCHFDEPNQHIDFANSPFYVNRDLQDWDVTSGPRRAAVSSFGFSGTNAHLVLEEYASRPEAVPYTARSATPTSSAIVNEASRATQQQPQVIVLSAKNEARLKAYTRKLLAYLEMGFAAAPVASAQNAAVDIQTVQQGVRAMVAALIGVDVAEIDLVQTFAECGLDAVQLSHLQTQVVEMIAELSEAEGGDSGAAQGHDILAMTRLAAEDSVASVAQRLSSPLPTATDSGQIPPPPVASLTNIAYNLQVGRTAMAARVAFVVSTIEELIARLRDIAQNQSTSERVYQGNTDVSTINSTLVIGGEAGAAFLQIAIRNRELQRLAQLWVSGVEIDWQLLHEHERPCRISLPTYPFARERYWIPTTGQRLNQNSSMIRQNEYNTLLHPLVHTNISDLEEQRFRTILTGSEFFLTDHQVQGEKVLPGVAYLEMARAAGELALRDQDITQIKDMIWARPITVEQDEPYEVHIGLYPVMADATRDAVAAHAARDAVAAHAARDAVAAHAARDAVAAHTARDENTHSQIAFEVSSGGESERMVHSQGTLVVGVRNRPVALDIPRIAARCPTTIAGEDCYQLFAQQDVAYGPAFQGVARISYSQNEAVAQLRLPPTVSSVGSTGATSNGTDSADYGLHPSLMDAALQATMGLALRQNQPERRTRYLPFAVREVNIYAALPTQGYAHVQYSDGEKPKRDVVNYDISLTDDAGAICVTFKGFAVRAVHGEVGLDQSPPGLLYSTPTWQVKPLAYSADGDWGISRATTANTLMLTVGLVPRVVETLTTTFDQAKVVELEPTHAEELLQQSWPHVQATIQERATAARQIIVVAADTVAYQRYAPLVGLLKTASLEEPDLRGKVLTVANLDIESLLDLLRQEIQPNTFQDVEVQYDATSTRTVKTLQEVELTTTPGEQRGYLRSGGVYWITGGLGKLGRIFARHLLDSARQDNSGQANLENLKNITLVLSGRSAFNERTQQQLDKLNQAGGTVVYLPADISMREEVAQVVETIKARYGQLNGIIHSAGVLRDSFIVNKTAADLDAVLAPKVRGILNIDAMTQDEPLDFVVLFSSLAGVLGNVGQADYAAANAFLDSFAHHRQALVEAGKRRGRTLAINWPLWQAGGMTVDTETTAWLQHATGLTALETSAGLEAFNRGLMQEGITQLLVTSGDQQQLSAHLRERGRTSRAANARPSVLTAPEEQQLFQATERYLQELLSGGLKVPPAQIAANAPWEKYGFDSILALSLTRQLEPHFGELSKTLFFEFQNLADLTTHFVQTYPAQLQELLGVGSQDRGLRAEDASLRVATAATPAVDSAVDLTGYSRRTRWLRRNETATGQPKSIPRHPNEIAAPEIAAPEIAAPEIAIVGLSGRYPMARNLAEFWENLKSGRDCITEIPQERWDHSRYYAAEKHTVGKSYSKWGGFMDDVDKFDPLFFNIAPREAELLDPQERLFLEIAWQTLEDAGYTRQTVREQLQRQVGVFVGVMWSEYQLHGQGKVSLGSSYASIANRVSYVLDLHGPSLAVDTMCSSSLTSIHLACESIRRGECVAALAGGVNVSIHPNKYLQLAQGKFAATDGRCRSFGEGGDGYVPGEGVGAVLLKPLQQAEADGDQIYGVIKGSSMNHGGKTNGYTVPNPVAQAELIAATLTKSGVAPESISYIEAHGTGTALGDPIEIRGLSQAFAHRQACGHACAIGSVKSNIGHLESAAGIAGLTKVLLQMQHQQLVPSIHTERLNPHIDFDATCFAVQRELTDWPQPMIAVDGELQPVARRAGISSFGAGGANAHLIVEEYVQEPLPLNQSQLDKPTGLPGHPEAKRGEPRLIVLSAKNEAQLREYAHNLLRFIEKFSGSDQSSTSNQQRSLASMAYTLQVGREAMASRLAFVAEDMATLCRRLTAYLAQASDGEVLYWGQVRRDQTQPILFDQDEDLQAMIDQWIRKGKLEKLAQLWVAGVEIAWALLYAADPPRRMSLPTYPFARERYWLPIDREEYTHLESQAVEDHDVEPYSVEPPAEPTAARSMMLLTKAWDAVAGSPTDQAAGGRVAILATAATNALATAVARELADAWLLMPDAVRQMQAEAPSAWADCAGAIDLTGLDPAYAPAQEDAGILWLQRLIEHTHQPTLRLVQVTSRLEALQTTQCQIAGARQAALHRLLSSEYGKVRACHLDTDGSLEETAPLAAQILAEWQQGDDAVEICYRAGTRYRARLQETYGAEALKAAAQTPTSYPSDQVLWITGGTRGIGMRCAQHFVRVHGVKKLVLMGREAIPPREEWQRYLASPDAAPMLKQKIADVQALEAAGAEVLVLSGSLTDKAVLLRHKKRVEETLGSVFGVIHCAGLVNQENPAFIRKNTDEIGRVAAPKVAGLTILHELFATEALHFFVLCSSVAAIVPTLGAGQSDYAMANAYMDYFATQQQSQGLGQGHSETHYVSIQWPNWQTTGMGLVQSNAYQQSGFWSHTDEEGLALLDAVLALKAGPVVLPAVVRPAQFQPEQLFRPRPMQPEPATAVEPEPVNVPLPVDDIDGELGEAAISLDSSSALYAQTTAWLGELLRQELKLPKDRVETTLPFQEYGVDSVFLAQLVTRMERELSGVKLDPAVILLHPTIQSLSDYLVKTYPEALTALLESITTAENGEALNVDLQNSPNQNGTSTTNADSQHAKPGGVGISPPPFGTGCATWGAANLPQAGGGTESSSMRSVTQIAIVGMACHFPDAPTLQHFWDNLQHGRDSIQAVPPTRWNVDEFYEPQNNQSGKSISKWGAFLAAIEEFDPAYFDISEALAPQIDPLERQWLEVSAEALADAGYTKADLWGQAVGVFAGSRISNFAHKLAMPQKEAIVGTGQNFIAAHLAHIYNFRGPNLVVDTACASALTAIHLAIQSLRRGESTVALAGGVDILLDEAPYLALSAAQALSPDGRCKTFDAQANGIGLGEGCGVLVLKLLDQAIADGNKIYGVIEGSAINQDGYTMGVTTPNPEAQQALIEQALVEAQVDPRSITYVETHGTGTLIGDPIELKGLTGAFGQGTSDKQFCGVGSVKSNLGHLLSAAGAASIIKVLLSITHKALPPTLHCTHPNPRFTFAESPFYPVQELSEWHGAAGIHRAGVSAFGLGGHNAHLIVSDAGIPETHCATLEPRGEPVVFNRRRYWPTEPVEPVQAACPENPVERPAALIDDGQEEETRLKAEFMSFFEEDFKPYLGAETR